MWDWARRFWQKPAEAADEAPFSPSATFTSNFLGIANDGPVDANGQRGGRHTDQPIAGVFGRWSNVRVYLDVPATMAIADDVLFTLRGKSNGIWTILAEAPVSAMGLTINNPGATARLTGIGLAASGTACEELQVTARAKTAFVGDTANPVGRCDLELWGTQSPYGAVQGALGASATAGGYEDRPVEARAAEMAGWNRTDLVWYPLDVDSSGRLIPHTPTTPTRFSQATASGLLVAGSHEIVSAVVSNTSGGLLWFLLFDKAIAPVNTDVPIYSFAVADGASVTIPSDVFSGDRVTLGLGFAWSTQNSPLIIAGPGAGTIFSTVLARP